MHKLALALFFALFCIFSQSAPNGFNPDSISGYWLTRDNKAKIQIWRSGNKYYGRIASLKDPNDEYGKPKKDIHNPDPKLRSRPVIGLLILRDFTFNSQSATYEDGTIYDPESGNSYSCNIKFMPYPNTLQVRGYIGFSIFGRTEVWQRTK